MIFKTKLTILFIVFLGLSCSSEHDKEHKESTKYVVTSPMKVDTMIVKDYVCQIKSIQHIEIRSLEKGYLEKIYVDEGQFLKKGQLMFQIMPILYSAEQKKAKAEADYVEIEYQNTKQLFEKNVVSSNELALAKAKLEKALAELNLADTHLKFTQIKAPFDGIMDHFQVRLGSLLNEGDLMTTLSDNSQMWVYFNVSESEYLDYKLNISGNDYKKVKLKLANNQMFEYPGEVKTIEADFNNETGNIAFRATFPNSKGILRHGETGNIQMTIPLKNSILIPQKATYEVLEKKYVFVVGKDSIVHSKEITIASEIPDIYVIKNGLKEDEKIILEGIRKVKENDKITFTYEDPKSVFPKLKVYVE